MENGTRNGVPSNHDKDSSLNGYGDAASFGEPVPGEVRSEGGATSAKVPDAAPNGVGDAKHDSAETQKHVSKGPAASNALQNPSRMNDLPEEVRHITQGFIPLSTVLIRLAQATHDDLQKTIIESANIKWMPADINGNAANGSDLPEDNSEGNRKRKMTLLKFAQDAHAKWVKALVIANWSRNAQTVSKLIDLKAHLDEKRMLFDHTQNWLIGLKRDLGQARLPRPDLKTALQILTTGEAPWIPEPGYIPPPPLTQEEQLKWIEELNTLLALRLNLDDYDKIPSQFRNYSIQSGRVTFKVAGEFEVDLTIADEDFEKQFWFIDFRFLFTPSTGKVSDALMSFLEMQINDILGKEGLKGCYAFLHEFVLTHKINELKRQAVELARSSWTGHLKIEPLNRALAIQYWTNRYGPNAPKSWIMVAVHSGKEKNGELDPKHPSHLVARWYRDNKEITDVVIRLDANNLSADTLLKSVVAKHVEHILSSIHSKLSAAPRFVKRESFLRLKISVDEPLESSLEMQLGLKEKVALLIEPVTGFAAIQPHTRYVLQGETRLNHGGKDPADDGVSCLENIRWGFVVEEFNRRGRSAGWSMAKSPIGNDDVKQLIKTRDQYQPVFFQRQGLGQDWFVMMSLSLSGDEWWLIQARQNGSLRTLSASMRLQLTKGQPDLDDLFWNNLTLFTAGLIAHATELEELHRSGVRYTSSDPWKQFLPRQVKMPVIRFKLTDILYPRVRGKGFRSSSSEQHQQGQASSAWAEDCVDVLYKGVRLAGQASRDSSTALNSQTLGTTVDATLRVRNPSRFKQLHRQIDRNVTFDRRLGQFAFRLQGFVGVPIFQQLTEHIKSIDRLVGFLDATHAARGSIKVKEVTLRKIQFSYTDVALPGGEDGSSEQPKEWTAIVDMSTADGVRLVLESGNPHLRILDYLTKLVNAERGLSILMAFIGENLPVLKGCDAIESRWEDMEAAGHGYFQCFPRAADWFCLRYRIANKQGQPCQIFVDVRVKTREGASYWFVTRRDREKSATTPQQALDEELAKALDGVWNSRGEGWQGLSTGATAPLGCGVLALLLALDDAIRDYVNGNKLTDPNTTNWSGSSSGPVPGAAPKTGPAGGGGSPTQPPQQQKNQGQKPKGNAAQQKPKQGSKTGQGQAQGQQAQGQGQPQKQKQNQPPQQQGVGNKSGGQNAPVVVLD